MGCPASRDFREVGSKAAGSRVVGLCGRGWNLHLEDLPLIDSYRSSFAEGVGAVTAPAPQLWRCHQFPLYRIMVHVVQLLDPFALAPNVEVVEAFLPDVLRGVLEQIST